MDISMGCAGRDCPASFRGDMPRGWCWLTIYWSPRPKTIDFLVDPVERDAVLCPMHRSLLESMLKDI
jgi:hypothetical protein